MILINSPRLRKNSPLVNGGNMNDKIESGKNAQTPQ